MCVCVCVCVEGGGGRGINKQVITKKIFADHDPIMLVTFMHFVFTTGQP